MSDWVIETSGLTRTFGDHVAVNDVNLRVPRRSIYGFLGHNGAGKSTTIRCILGLLRPDNGSVRLFGEPFSENRGDALKRIGSLIEGPALYEHLSGRENLDYTRRLRGADASRVDHVLNVVGLTDSANRHVKEYSMGMKQRLGLALALLDSPDLLILDEPTNGLDPAGMRDVRNLIQSLPEREDVTVFLSSHLLDEVERVATHVGIIQDGRMMFQAEIEQLRQHTEQHVVIGANPIDQARRVLTADGHQVTVLPEGRVAVAVQEADTAARCNALLVREGVSVTHLHTHSPSLEETFLQMTGQGGDGALDPSDVADARS